MLSGFLNNTSMEDLGNLPPSFPKDENTKTPRLKPNKHKIFVYGSLLKGLGNHSLLLTSKLLGEHVTKKKYLMKSFGGYPAVYKANKISSKAFIMPSDRVRFNSLYRPVQGEVYEVDDYTLKDLDGLESNGYFYLREKVELADYPDECWMYICLREYTNMPLVDLDLNRNYSWKEYLRKSYGY